MCLYWERYIAYFDVFGKTLQDKFQVKTHKPKALNVITSDKIHTLFHVHRLGCFGASAMILSFQNILTKCKIKIKTKGVRNKYGYTNKYKSICNILSRIIYTISLNFLGGMESLRRDGISFYVLLYSSSTFLLLYFLML